MNPGSGLTSHADADQRPREQKAVALDVFWLLLFGLASSLWCITAAQALSATFDEPTYLRLGLEQWWTGSYKGLMRLGTMPLAIDLQTLPLHLWEKWQGVRIDSMRDLPWALPVARAGTLVFWWALLIYAWRAARAIGGPWAGRLAVALIACEPTFLAHASLATTDIAVAACLLVFLYEFRAHREARWPLRILLPAVLYGVALLSKASALVFGVIGMLAIEIERLIASGVLTRATFKRALFEQLFRDAAAIVGGGLAVTFIYCGSDWTTERSFVEWAQTLAPGTLRDTMLWIAEHLRIFTNAGEGLAQQIKHNFRGHPTYILGHEYRRSIWFYFPVALTIKTTLPLLLLPFVTGAINRRALWNWACLTTAALVLFSFTCRVQIGIRFMLPLLALLAVGLAAAMTHAHASVRAPRRHWLVALIAAALLWNAAASCAVWPQALCYTNPAWGGTANGYRWLSDSNYDWGQGLLELGNWGTEHGVGEIGVWYFGTDPRMHQPPLRHMPFHANEWLQGRSPADAAAGSCIAVSTTVLHGAYVSASDAGRAAVTFFKAQQPVGRTTTYFIYDFRSGRR